MALEEGAFHDTLFDQRRKPVAVKVGSENHIADVTHMSGITTPRQTHGQSEKGTVVVR